MYRDALDFLEEERDAWAPFETLAALSDDDLERPTDPAGPGHGWSGRDLMGHLLYWQENALAVATELAVGERSETKERTDVAWEAGGDALNQRALEAASAVPLGQLRERFKAVPGELRGFLTVVPETRWLKNQPALAYLLGETTEHYQEHRGELQAILAGSAGGHPPDG